MEGKILSTPVLIRQGGLFFQLEVQGDLSQKEFLFCQLESLSMNLSQKFLFVIGRSFDQISKEFVFVHWKVQREFFSTEFLFVHWKVQREAFSNRIFLSKVLMWFCDRVSSL